MQKKNRIVGIGIALGSAFGLLGGAVLADRPLSEATFEDLQTAYPGVEASWRDGYVRSVHGVPMSAGAETPEVAAEDWLLLWGEVFGAEGFDYDLDWTADAGEGLAVVRFDQVIDGVNVDGGTGRVVLRQTEGLWQPVMAWCNSAPLGSEDLGAINFGSGAALLLAQAHEDAAGLEDWSEPELAVYANELLGRDDARLAWKVLGWAGLMGSAAEKHFFVDAEPGGLLGVRSGISAGTIDGTVDGSATSGLKPNTTTNPPALVNLEDVTVEAPAYNISDVTDDQGDYSLTGNFSGTVSVEARLEGPTWEVQHPITSTTAPIFKLTGTASSFPATVDFTFNSGSASAPISIEETAVVNGHVLTFEASNFFTSRVNSITLSDLTVWPYYTTSPFPGGCGGFYSAAGNLVYFLPAGSDSTGTCVPACYRSFFGHEFAHSYADQNLGGEYLGAWGEGFGDSLVVVMNDTGIMGEDFYGPGNHVRNPGTAGATYPYCVTTSHDAGMLLSGIWFDLIDDLGLSTTQDLFVDWTLVCDPFKRPGVAPCTGTSQAADADTIVEVLTADDDNNTLADGTPNKAAICAVFNARGITHPTYCP